MKQYSITQNPGKIRGLKSICNNGLIYIAALDHRKSFLELFDRDLLPREVRTIKNEMLSYLEKQASAVLLDTNYGFGLESGKIGLILSLESTGYSKVNNYKETKLLDGWDIGKIKKSGASGVKLVLYIDPTSNESTKFAHDLAKKIAKTCLAFDLLFLIEPIVPKNLKDRGGKILDAIICLSDINADIFKIEYPGKERIKEVNGLVQCPWTLLSGGADYKEFKEALRISCTLGCCGYVAGRTLWQEIGQKKSKRERQIFLSEIVLPRFIELKKITQQKGTSLWKKVMIDNSIRGDWYSGYKSLAS